MRLAPSLLLLTLALSSQAVLAQPLGVEDAQVRAVPPGSPTSAAFMTLHNAGESDIAVVDAHSPAAGVLDLHRHVEADGVMQMRRIPEVVVPAGGSADLAPGGLHLMLIDLTAPLAEGDEVAITLVLDGGETVEFAAPVRSVTTSNASSQGHGAHAH